MSKFIPENLRHKPSSMAVEVHGAENVIAVFRDGSEYTRHGGQLIRVNKPQLSKKDRNKYRRLRSAASQ